MIKAVHKEETWDCCQYNTVQVRLQEPPAQQGIFIMALKCPGYWQNQLKLLNKCFLEKGQNIRRESNRRYVQIGAKTQLIQFITHTHTHIYQNCHLGTALVKRGNDQGIAGNGILRALEFKLSGHRKCLPNVIWYVGGDFCPSSIALSEVLRIAPCLSRAQDF